MKESEPKIPLRNILVCYDNSKQVGWRTEEEFKELSEKFDINWYVLKTKEGLVYFKNERKIPDSGTGR